MSLLILSLPLTVASPNSLYAFIEGPGAGLVREATAPLLPRSGRKAEVVAVLPARALSWHAVDLPAGKVLGGLTLRTLLVGLLEDRLLDDVQQLHLALQPGWKPGQSAWVAVCHKAWLQGHLQALESADIAVNRIVPPFSPAPVGAPAQLIATGTPPSGWLWVSAAQGVWGLPTPSGLDSLRPALLSSAQLSAEPAIAEWAEHHLTLKPRLLHPAERLWTAAQSEWDLAQFELAATGSARWLKALARWQLTLWQSSAWRPARWGLAVLLLSQLLGLNAWAWKLTADLRQRQLGMAQVVTQTFPDMQVVVDAPVQMRREVARLRQAAGQPGSDGLEPLLAALGQALPTGVALNEVDFQPGELRLKDLRLNEAQAGQLQSQLAAHHLQARRVGAEWVITAVTAPNRSTP